MEAIMMKIALIGGIISFIILSSFAASIISGLAALIVIGCVKIAERVIAFVTGGRNMQDNKIIVL